MWDSKRIIDEYNHVYINSVYEKMAFKSVEKGLFFNKQHRKNSLAILEKKTSTSYYSKR